MVGGDDEAFAIIEPVLKTIAPGRGRRSIAPRAATGRPAPEERGYLHCGPSGAGHFVKMVHNGIEYGIMAAFAEGLNILTTPMPVSAKPSIPPRSRRWRSRSTTSSTSTPRR